ncbi:MAG: acylphosphatase [Thermoprotei archaeon]|nr:MAG: acylphosphatase [Thermoprotei archaeon]RLF25505.1 MAG: acylphosphatase [Thermoprotei archaeon]
MEMIRVLVRIYGVVQGVGFRAFAQYHARRLGLKGYVKNLSDGSVEIVAEGPRVKIEQYLDIIRRGPPSAIVERVEVYYKDYKGEYEDFYLFW